jgi:hypothetical protein
VAYWLERTAGVALGYTIYGFSGSGIEPGSERSDRLYLRFELAY